MDSAVVKIRNAFICQLSPNVTHQERSAAFHHVQKFKEEQGQVQVRVIFQLINDSDRELKNRRVLSNNHYFKQMLDMPFLVYFTILYV